MKDRLLSLDAFRGATVAGMILVNNPGDWSAVYPPLEHAPWHGWTPTDLIFPFFLFIVGASLAFSRRTTFAAAAKRSLILFGLGVFMAAFPFFDLRTVRIPGVLQRIALCYLAAWGARRLLKPGGMAALASALLVFYFVLMTRVASPDAPTPNLEPGTNLAAYFDRLLLPGHLWKQTQTWDPEGPLSTIPAIATTLLGVLAGLWLTSERKPRVKVTGLIAGGALLMVAGLAWGEVFPINKNLWTSSYVLFTGGMAACLFGSFYGIADVLGRKSWTGPFVVFGVNAILVFVGSGLLAKSLALAKVQPALYRALFASWLSPLNASLAFALANVFFWYGVLLLLSKRGIRLKV